MADLPRRTTGSVAESAESHLSETARSGPDTHCWCDSIDMADTTKKDYRVVIHGELGDQFCVLFAPMRLQRDHGTTILTGPIWDQSQLLELVARIQELGCELVSVQRCADLVHSGPETGADSQPAPEPPGEA